MGSSPAEQEFVRFSRVPSWNIPRPTIRHSLTCGGTLHHQQLVLLKTFCSRQRPRVAQYCPRNLELTSLTYLLDVKQQHATNMARSRPSLPELRFVCSREILVFTNASAISIRRLHTISEMEASEALRLWAMGMQQEHEGHSYGLSLPWLSQ